MQDGDSSRTIRSAVANAMWEDSTKRARTLAPMNKMYKENFKQLSKEFRVSFRIFCNSPFYYYIKRSPI